MTKSRLGVVAFFFVVSFGAAAPLHARVVSYAPITSRYAIPAVESRTSRHVLLLELDNAYPYGMPSGVGPGRIVLYDSSGAAEPRLLLPDDGQPISVGLLALEEEADGVPVLLVATDASVKGDNPSRSWRHLLSTDGGATWHVLALPYTPGPRGLQGGLTNASSNGFFDADFGGPLVRGRRSNVRLGTTAFPFVLLDGGGSMVAVSRDGTTRLLLRTVTTTPDGLVDPADLVGTDATGMRFLVAGRPVTGSETAPVIGEHALYLVDLDGHVTKLLPLSDPRPSLEGWITPSDVVTMEIEGTLGPTSPSGVPKSIVRIQNGSVTTLAAATGTYDNPVGTRLFAVPSADFREGWVIQRNLSTGTSLSRITSSGALEEQWRDVTGPEVEALHAGASGARLLVQAHRPRPTDDNRIFRDPALAVWKIGDGAPLRYDELFLVEQGTKGFVHLDVDAAAAGASFLFDSGIPYIYSGGGGPSGGGGGGGGSDVTQEWGVVKGSLCQRLVIPAVARTSGFGGAFWKTDVVLQNPDDAPLAVALRFVPNDKSADRDVHEASLTLQGHEIRSLDDVLAAVFGLEAASGALRIDPEGDRSLNATSRTYTRSSRGTYGMGVPALDVHAALGPGFPTSFAAALPGNGFRSNLLVTDTSGRGTRVALRLANAFGEPIEGGFLDAPAGGQIQASGVGDLFQAPSWLPGSLLLSPRTGEAISTLIAIDNTTNDPNYFPPDLSAGVPRQIPAVVHADGANGARFRSDLFLVNPSAQAQSIMFLLRPWDLDAEFYLSLTLLPYESKTIRDVLSSAFGRTGVARLYFQSSSPGDPSGGVRVTSRTYTISADGGTYGLSLPPLNAFQSAGPGETLEILGPRGDAHFRTNLALVDLTVHTNGQPPNPPARVEILDENGRSVDHFDVVVPVAGGLQLADLFRARGLGDGPHAASIRVTPAAGLLAAYATMIDNGTNDPTLFTAQLAAR